MRVSWFVAALFNTLHTKIAVAADETSTTPHLNGQFYQAFKNLPQSPLVEQLNSFVASQRRLPTSRIKVEKPLYTKMHWIVYEGKPEGKYLSPEVVELIRHETFYRNAFVLLVSKIEESNGSRGLDYYRRAELFRSWGDDANPVTGDVDFSPLIMAQSARRRKSDGALAFDDLNQFVKLHGRLPSVSDDKALIARLKLALSEASPFLLQLNARSLYLLQQTSIYQLSKTAFDLKWEGSTRPSADLRFKAAVWRLLSRDSN